MAKVLTKKEMEKFVKQANKDDKKRRKLLSHKVFNTFRRERKRKDKQPDFIKKAVNESFWALLEEEEEEEDINGCK